MTYLTRIHHPHKHGGYRWAVHLCHPDPLDAEPLKACLNAGHGDTLESALQQADLVFMAVWRALLATGQKVEAFRADWEHDPVTDTEHDKVLVLAEG